MAQKQADILLQHDVFMLTGELAMTNVMSVREKSLRQFAAHQEITIDFSQLKSSDSSGLALLLDWIAYANKHKRKIYFKQLSAEILSVAKAAGLEALLLPLTR